jgi:chemotaxis protein MotB
MGDDKVTRVIIKRRTRARHEHHGGAWKIAYADFVTALMALFLLMWMLGSTTQAQRRGIADYFHAPLKVALLGGDGSGDATSLVKGGGEDLSKSVGEDSRRNTEFAARQRSTPASMPPPTSAPSAGLRAGAGDVEIEAREKVRLQDLKSKLQGAIESKSTLRLYKNQILLDLTAEGLRIQIVDDQNRPMFASGSARMEPYTSPILREIGSLLNQVGNRVSLAGHTDATPYAGGERGYSNWELSADRANASRRELVAGGMEEDKIIRVVGLGAALPFDTTDPYNPMNRRITIIVMKRKVEEAIRSEGLETLRANDAEGISRIMDQGGEGEEQPQEVRQGGAD